ncbi:aldehyde dehydrogenase family protein [Nocardioides pantholopis]|uniref:aldehyde dehydrogenase family protein n=1 Tax=Nocardioides pantholopis TaxID=2483798 RepID=UPI000FD8D468|nr:aldehyde dehydrogenase family protein [Nocardioides pantholopis]
MPAPVETRNAKRSRTVEHEIVTAVSDVRARVADWVARGIEGRIEVLAQWAEELRARRSELRAGLVADTGRIALSDMEIDSVLASIERQSGWARDLLGGPASRPSTDGSVLITDAPVPLGVVGVISPWNFPLQLALIDAVPALLAGCPVVVKPSEVTPGFVPALQASIAAVPALAEVLVVVEGGPEAGRELVSQVDAVCFTGSVRTGQAVAVAAAEAFVPSFLELGGKDAAIVAADADLDIASSAILWGSTANTGQSCMSLERVYAERSVAEELVELIVRKAAAVRLAVPTPADGEMGPFIDARQAAVVAEHVRDAVERGAVVRHGGEVEEHGGRPYLRPTVLSGVDHTMTVMTEETFGPVIPVMAVDDLDQAVELANDTRYGLSGAVFGSREVAQAVAARLEAGGVSINDVCLTGLVPEGEKQAFKLSGLGPSRMGPASVRRFLRQRVLLTREEPKLQPWWYQA